MITHLIFIITLNHYASYEESFQVQYQMQSVIPFFVYTAFGSILIFASLSLFLKYIIPEGGGSYQFLTIQFVFGSIVHLVVFVFQIVITGQFPTISLQELGWITLAGILGFVGFLCYILGLEVGNASVGGVVLSSRVFFSVPLAFLFVGEVYALPVYVYIIIAFLGAVLVSWQKGLSVRSVLTFQTPGMKYFLATAFFWSLQNFVIRQLNNSIPLIPFLTIRMLIFTVLALIGYIVLRSYFDLSPIQYSPTLSLKILIYAALVLLAEIGFIFALGENLSITETIGVFEGSITFILSVLFAKFISNKVLNEEMHPRILGIRVGGVLLSLIGTIGTISWI